ncbi:glycosyltransferase family 2 protein [Haemophilus sp.]|uniref:glycosyltransferase family 2 protein n=1 Tax=Haemophilus sp. TaxID=740 RepID=UPI003AEFDC50
MSNELISIIVPVYNVEQYLEKCVDSIINQTYTNIEIILVDDGSTDSSGFLCDSLAKKDPRISVYHKENGGLSSARNFGIEKAHGAYLGFIDSDDYIDPDMYETLYNLIKKDNSDVAMCGLYNIYANNRDKQVDRIDTLLVDKEEAIKIVLDGKLTTISAVNKLYKKDIFNNLKYDVGKFYEDAFIIVRLLEQCNKISITNERKYYYYHRSSSITTQRFTKKQLDMLEAWSVNFNIVKERYPKIIDSAKRRVFWAYFYVLDLLCFSDDREKYSDLVKKLIAELKNNSCFILMSPNFTIKRKALFISLFISEELYKKLILKLKNRVN